MNHEIRESVIRMKTKTVASVVCFGLFLLLIAAVKTIDVAKIGPAETSIGLSGINGAIHEMIGLNMKWYKLTNYLGILAILIGCCFAVLGLIQLIQRKSLLKVDRELLILGGLFVLMAIVYVLFEFIVINERPVLMPGETHPEASFPSSHTVLVYVILGGVMMIIGKYVDNSLLCGLIQAVFGVLILAMVFLRLFSGVHWFTDIVGGILLSSSMLFLFAAILDRVSE